MAGKGDLRRPAAIPKDEFDRRWAEAFGRAAPCGSDQAGRRERKAREIGQLEMPLTRRVDLGGGRELHYLELDDRSVSEK